MTDSTRRPSRYRRPRPDLQRRRAMPSWRRSTPPAPGSLRRLHRRQRRRRRLRHRGGQPRQRLRHRQHHLDPRRVPGDRRAGSDLQRQPGRLRGQGNAAGTALSTAATSAAAATTRATASPWTARAAPMSREDRLRRDQVPRDGRAGPGLQPAGPFDAFVVIESRAHNARPTRRAPPALTL